MKNEILARAITGIDDELIIAAHSDSVSDRKNKKPVFFFAVAACFLLVCTISLIGQLNSGIKITVNGNSITKEPVLIDVPMPYSRLLSEDTFSFSLELEPRKETSVSISDGTIKVYSSETDELLYCGESYKTNEAVTLLWEVAVPAPATAYKMRLNKTVLILSFDENTNQWTIKMQ